MLNEFIEVCNRPKIRKVINEDILQQILSKFDTFAIYINVTSKVDLCRDAKDNFLLELAIDSKSNFLITGDNDLLILKKIGRTKIVSWSEFKKQKI